MDPEKETDSCTVASAANRESFLMVEARAREVLRERGLTEVQIEAQLRLGKRQLPED